VTVASGGTTLAKLALRHCVVAVVRRGDRLVAPRGSTQLREGDVLTLIGTDDGIREARERLQDSS
jgi:Trk K+ transport system NAD-binding subunit